MSNIQVLGDLELAGALSFQNNLSEFPLNPPPRTIVVKSGVPYIYTELVDGSGFLSWQPFGSKQASYLHTQGVASTVWTVNHNFNTADFAYFVYDDTHRLVVANIEIIDNNTCRIVLTQAMTGTVVLFSLQYMNAVSVTASQQLTLGTSVLTTDAGVLKVGGNDIAFKAYVDAQDTALSTRIDNVLSNVNPSAVDSISELLTAFQSADGNLSTALTSLSASTTAAVTAEQGRALLAEAGLASELAGLQSTLTTQGTTLQGAIDGLAAVASTGSFADLVNLPTTLVGYGIVDAYTKGQVDSAISAATPTFNSLTGKPTTLSGYGITDAYTKTAVDSAIAAATPTFSSLTGKPTTVSGYGITDAYTKTEVTTSLSGKVDVIAGKGLSTEDFTTAEKSKLAGVESGAQVNTVSSVAGKTGIVTLVKGDVGLANVDNTSDVNKPISTATQSALNLKANIASLATVATSGSYADLTNKPTIPSVPTTVSSFTNDSGYLVANDILGKASLAGSVSQDFAIKDLTVGGNIMPAITGVSTIGSATDKFAAIYTKEMHIDANTLYVDGVAVLGSSANTIQITADVNQGIRIATTGTGTTVLDSHAATTIQTNGTNADVLVQTTGTGSLARVTSGTKVVLTAPTIEVAGDQTVSGSLTVGGNFTVTGVTTFVNSTNLQVKDNVITVNKGENGSGVSATYAGIDVDRGDLARQRLVWNESAGKWQVGATGTELSIATESYVTTAISGKANTSSLATVATSGSYADLTNKPSIPSKVSDLTNDSGYQTAVQVSSAISAATPTFSSLTGKPTTISGYGITDAYTKSDIDASLAGKVDKVTGKGLSTEDFTSAEKSKLAGIESGAQVNTVTSVAGKTGIVTLDKGDVGLANVDNTSDVNKPISTATQSALNLKANIASLATVATSGAYADLTGKPTKVSDFTNDSNFQTGAQVTSAIQAVVGVAPAALDTLAEIAAQLASDESAVSALTTTVSGKADKATTLSGYGITDAYTKTAVDSAIAAATPTFSSLTGKPTTISGYGITDAYTKTEVDTAVSAKADKATTYTKDEVDAAIAAAIAAFAATLYV